MAHDISASPRSSLALATALAVFAIAALVGAPGAQAASCSTQSTAFYLPNGNGYITSMTVAKIGCATGRKVAQAFNKCRRAKGREGRCTSKVLGYSCKETKRTKVPTEINARVTCTRGAKRVVHTYQQLLQ